MYPIHVAYWLAPGVRRLEVVAPRIAARHRPGHFVIVRAHDEGERIPLTVADTCSERGTVTLIVQSVGATTERLCALGSGDVLPDVVGPLGRPTEVRQFGRVVLVGGGVGTAVLFPQAKALGKAGNQVDAVIGARDRAHVIFEAALGECCRRVLPCTDDGSHGFHGFVTERLAQVLDEMSVDAVFTAGPVPMMKAVAEVTHPRRVHTMASLNPVMVDGTGMCGGCRVTVGGQTRFACVEGPEFDAHAVDFDELTDRLTAYRAHEIEARRRLANDRKHTCRLRAATIEAAQTGGD